ncbi:hypothetical protein [Actinomadura sp. KC345]|uniref:hypothetical protein n=1 Tax=Actinomadura sp. KC345 TaxID=2530371 RepID=UPI001A9E04B5|nr:hypothetical protein [Actinomadura sp. KC345]
MADPFDTPSQGTEDVQRDRFGRPLVVPPEGGKPEAYRRCTTHVSVLEDMYLLQRRQMRMVALGMANRPDLVLATGAHRDDRNEMNRIVDQSMEAAQAHAQAKIGTGLHKFTDTCDRGEPLGPVPEAYRADLDAYTRATSVLEVIEIERFVVLDELKIGGTPDRIVRYQGRSYIADLKTGSIEYGALKIAMQLAVYSRSMFYDPVTHERTPLDVDQDRAIVIHLPAGQGRCELHWVDIATGWEAVQVANQVWQWRKRKGLFAPLTDVPAEIAAASTIDDLMAVWGRHQAGWTDDLTALAAARKAELTGGAR